MAHITYTDVTHKVHRNYIKYTNYIYYILLMKDSRSWPGWVMTVVGLGCCWSWLLLVINVVSHDCCWSWLLLIVTETCAKVWWGIHWISQCGLRWAEYINSSRTFGLKFEDERNANDQMTQMKCGPNNPSSPKQTLKCLWMVCSTGRNRARFCACRC